MEAKDWLKSIKKSWKLPSVLIGRKYFSQRINYLEPLLIGGRLTAALTQMLVLSPEMSSKTGLELTTYLVVHSS
jgi:hypothetical protein